jgi:hypothetical protein
MARRRRLPQGPDLAERDFRERHRAFVFIRRNTHQFAPAGE